MMLLVDPSIKKSKAKHTSILGAIHTLARMYVHMYKAKTLNPKSRGRGNTAIPNKKEETKKAGTGM